MNPPLRRLHRYVHDKDPRQSNRWQAGFIWTLRLLFAIADELASGRLALWAMSLVYTTLLSLVPLLAVSFSVLKGFGVHNQLLPALLTLLEPLGERGLEIGHRIVGFVENMDVGVLGTMGLALLVFTVISLIEKIEKALNEVWRVKRKRSFAQRFTGYLSIILIGPVLIFSAVGVTASLMSQSLTQELLDIEPLGTAFHFFIKILPYALVTTAFTLVYILIPNTHVKPLAALAGGVCAGVLWETAGWLFANFVVSSGSYTAIYSTFAILIMFMVWLYLSWLILLLGAKVAYFIHHPGALNGNGEDPIQAGQRLHLGLTLWRLIGRRFLEGQPAWTVDELASRTRCPPTWIEDLLGDFRQAGLLEQSADEPPRQLPARDLDAIPLASIILLLTRQPPLTTACDEEAAAAAETLRQMDDALMREFADINLRQWLSRKAG